MTSSRPAAPQKSDAIEPENLRDTVPDGTSPTNGNTETRHDCASIRDVILQSLQWYSPQQNINIRKLIPQESHAFRVKLFNLLKTGYLQEAFRTLPKETEKQRLLRRNTLQRATLEYLGLLRAERYQQYLNDTLLDQLKSVFQHGDWQSAQGIGTMLEEIRNMLTTPFE